MNIRTLTIFLMRCTIINFVLLLLAGLSFVAMQDFVHGFVGNLIPLPRETLNELWLLSIMVFRGIWFFFNLVPLLVLLSMPKPGPEQNA